MSNYSNRDHVRSVEDRRGDSGALISHGRALRTKTSLLIPPGIPIAAWRSLGQEVHAISSSSAWWLGDWLIYGQAEYPDRYKRALAQTSLDYQTLRNYAWVARRFEPSERVQGASFQHHAEVAGLAPEERANWLRLALEKGWSRNELRRQVRASKQVTGGARTPMLFRMSPGDTQRRRWQEAADVQSVDLLEWITKILDEAS